jgi:hypothetical protein
MIMSPYRRGLRDAFHPFPVWPTAEEALGAAERTHAAVEQSRLERNEYFSGDRLSVRVYLPRPGGPWEDAIERVVIHAGEVVELSCVGLDGRRCDTYIRDETYRAIAGIAHGVTITIRWDGIHLVRTMGSLSGLFILADGSDPAVIHQHGRWGARPTRAADSVDHTTAVADLVRRWQGLRSPRDRMRVTHFWMGHANPILAEAGLATLHVAPHPHMTPSPVHVRR